MLYRTCSQTRISEYGWARYICTLRMHLCMSRHERQQRLVSTRVLAGVGAGAYARVNKYRQINAYRVAVSC